MGAPRRPPSYPAGQKFGRLVYEQFTRRSDAGKAYGRYQCECGTTKELRIDSVRAGGIKSCGCLPTGVAPGTNPPGIAAGDRYGRLIFVSLLSDRTRYRGEFACDCGSMVET